MPRVMDNLNRRNQPSRHITTKDYWVRGCYVIYSRPTKKKKIEISQTQQKFKQYNTTSKIQSPTLKEDTTYCCASSYWLVSGAGVTCSRTFVFTTSLPREKKKKNKWPLSRLTPNIGGQILSYEASSLPPEQASCHCQGISSHNSARPSDSVTRATRCFHFFEIPLTNLLLW